MNERPNLRQNSKKPPGFYNEETYIDCHENFKALKPIVDNEIIENQAIEKYFCNEYKVLAISMHELQEITKRISYSLTSSERSKISLLENALLEIRYITERFFHTLYLFEDPLNEKVNLFMLFLTLQENVTTSGQKIDVEPEEQVTELSNFSLIPIEEEFDCQQGDDRIIPLQPCYRHCIIQDNVALNPFMTQQD